MMYVTTKNHKDKISRTISARTKTCTFKLGLRPHATQGTRPPYNYNALFTIKNIKRNVCKRWKAYLRVRGGGGDI